MSSPPQICITDMPDPTQPQVDFLESTWFKTHGKTQAFPSPDHVRSFIQPRQGARPVTFAQLGLVVKFGVDVHTSEGVALWMMNKLLKDKVPVPEVYGWRVVERAGKSSETFIYMQHIQGPTLERMWESMSSADKSSVCSDLRAMTSCYREVRFSGLQPHIGSIRQEAGSDRCLEGLPSLRPFPTRASFHDWLSWLWRRDVPNPKSIEDPWRQLLPDEGPIVLTHGDLRPANIIVTAQSPVRVAAIVDWEQAGWYPDYWEYCKAAFTASHDGEWRGWIDQFLKPQEAALEAFDFYTMALGKF